MSRAAVHVNVSENHQPPMASLNQAASPQLLYEMQYVRKQFLWLSSLMILRSQEK